VPPEGRTVRLDEAVRYEANAAESREGHLAKGLDDLNHAHHRPRERGHECERQNHRDEPIPVGAPGKKPGDQADEKNSHGCRNRYPFHDPPAEPEYTRQQQRCARYRPAQSF